ncbi:glycerophosphoinositol permease 1 [Colletotrichum liriopes]|uniref:Glycerophosphoinositol permease 1 n=1 Tax=Colletotrichum liriopes TaxID=708192 RepID=A0AA37LMX4_9PEZI|nr:glycerophosphoinositol permease 1 [Colletotrichum liriopes]
MESLPRVESAINAADDPFKKDIGVFSSSERDDVSSQEPDAPARTAGKLDVLIQGVALFSDGYNIQIIGYMNTVLAKLYPKQMTNEVKTRLSNSILVGDIFGMLIFGLCIDKFGRRVGIILTTLFLVLVSIENVA